MTNLEAPPRTAPTTLPAPTMDVVADRAPLPPPPLRVPAVSPAALPPLSGAPIVPPMPRFSLDGETPHGQPTPPPPAPPVAAAVVDQADALLPCPPIVEAAPVFSLPGDAAPAAAPTTEVPIVEPLPGASPSEPLGTPPAIAMVMPSLPVVGGAPTPTDTPAVPVSHHPTQTGAAPMTSRASALESNVPQELNSHGGFAKAVLRTVMATVLAGAVGVGAHVGYDWWEARNTTAVGGVSVDGSDVASWPQIDPPAIRYTDSVTVFTTLDGVRTLTAHREIGSGRTQAVVESTDAAGTDLGTVEVDYRGEQSMIRITPDSPWAATSAEDALARIGDNWTTDVLTVSDIFPAAALPYITVLESVERVLPVRPLVPAVAADAPVATPIAISSDPTSMVWQYRVLIDVESFRANETAVFQEWSRRLGRSAAPRIEAWVDATGIVRQITVDVDGTMVTHTLVGGAANSNRFDVNPILDSAPAAPAAIDPAAPAAIDPAAPADPAAPVEVGG